MVKQVYIESREQIEHINKVAASKEYNIGISCGNYVTLDLKSLLALYPLIGQICNITFPDHLDIQEAFRTLKQMKLA